MATTPQQAAQKVIELKKQYDANAKADKNFYKSDSAKQISQQANSLRQQYGLDDNKYGSGATLAQAYTNYYKEYGSSNTSKQPTKVQQPQQPIQQAPQQKFEPTPYAPSQYEKQIEALINSLPANMLSYEDAKKQADEQLGQSYDKALADTMKNIDRQSLQTGFFGQLPTVDYKQRNADEIERSRATSVSQLAQQLVNDSKMDVQSKINALSNFSQNMSEAEYRNWQQQLQGQQYADSRNDIDWEKAFKERGYVDSRGDVDWEKTFKEREYTDTRNDVDWEKLFKERQYTDSRTDAEWQKGVTEAQLTGIFKGNPTMALTELSHRMNMDTKQMEMAEKKMNHDITMSWENLKNSRTSLGQAAARIGLQSQAQNLDLMKFNAGVKETAFEMTMQDFSRTGQATFDPLTGDYALSGSVTTGDIVDTMDMYTKILLGDLNADDLYKMDNNNQYNSGAKSAPKYDGRAK